MMLHAGMILVVDDEPSIRTILTHQLEQAGYDVRSAADGPQALAILQRELPDLILLDVMMPGMDGYAVLERIRAEGRTHHLPVIMLTAKGEKSHVLQGLGAGANDYIVKPFAREELLLRITNLLALSRGQRDANPLTGLPGNRAIADELEARLRTGKPFGYLYIDLDNFKAYNDYYGYSRGDRVLTTLAETLTEVAARTAPDAFIGHIGGDDYVVLTGADEARPLADGLVEEFSRRRRYLYDPEDWSRGYLELPDRVGQLRRFPPVALTVVVIVDREGRFRHPGRLLAAVAELKQFGKQHPGDIVVQDRRTPADTGVEAPITAGTFADHANGREEDDDT